MTNELFRRAARRRFLRAGAALAATGLAGAGRHALPLAASLSGLAALSAHRGAAAQSTNDYKALVCLFMNGGNDSHNWLVPTDAAGYADYAAARRELAWPADRLLAIGDGGQGAGRSFGMPQELQPLRKWYQSGQLGLVANVGPLQRPLTKTDYMNGLDLPPKLFSHNDQASIWQSLSPEGSPSGWGGRMGDILMSANAYPVFTAVSATGNAVFLSGSTVTQYEIGVQGPVAVGGINGSSIFAATKAPAALRRSLAAPGTAPLQAEYVRVMQRSIDASALLGSALAGVAVPAIPATVIPLGSGGSVTLSNDSLAQQLRIVATMIAAGPALGMRRQVFMVSMGGFDSHTQQMRDQPSQMARVAQAVDYFLGAINTLGRLDGVTLFSASDFGRTLSTNGSGSDHGWGSHHFVAGGAVRGGQIHGRFPATRIGSSDDVGSGRLLPSSAVVQMAATMGRWLGLSATDVASVLPTLENFDAQALAFL